MVDFIASVPTKGDPDPKRVRLDDEEELLRALRDPSAGSKEYEQALAQILDTEPPAEGGQAGGGAGPADLLPPPPPPDTDSILLPDLNVPANGSPQDFGLETAGSKRPIEPQSFDFVENFLDIHENQPITVVPYFNKNDSTNYFPIKTLFLPTSFTIDRTNTPDAFSNLITGVALKGLQSLPGAPSKVASRPNSDIWYDSPDLAWFTLTEDDNRVKDQVKLPPGFGKDGDGILMFSRVNTRFRNSNFFISWAFFRIESGSDDQEKLVLLASGDYSRHDLIMFFGAKSPPQNWKMLMPIVELRLDTMKMLRDEFYQPMEITNPLVKKDGKMEPSRHEDIFYNGVKYGGKLDPFKKKLNEILKTDPDNRSPGFVMMLSKRREDTDKRNEMTTDPHMYTFATHFKEEGSTRKMIKQLDPVFMLEPLAPPKVVTMY